MATCEHRCDSPGCEAMGRWPIQFVGAFPQEINGVPTPAGLEGFVAHLCDDHVQPIIDAKLTGLADQFDGSRDGGE